MVFGRKTKTQKYEKTNRQKDIENKGQETKRQKYRKTRRQKDRKTKREMVKNTGVDHFGPF